MTLTFLIEALGFMAFFGVVAASSYEIGRRHAEKSGILAALRSNDWAYRNGYQDAKKLAMKRMTLVGKQKRS